MKYAERLSKRKALARQIGTEAYYITLNDKKELRMPAPLPVLLEMKKGIKICIHDFITRCIVNNKPCVGFEDCNY